MVNNAQFHSDMADEGHIGEAIGFYEANKRVLHLYAPGCGHHRIPAANADEAERIFWDFVNGISDSDQDTISEA